MKGISSKSAIISDATFVAVFGKIRVLQLDEEYNTVFICSWKHNGVRGSWQACCSST